MLQDLNNKIAKEDRPTLGKWFQIRKCVPIDFINSDMLPAKPSSNALMPQSLVLAGVSAASLQEQGKFT